MSLHDAAMNDPHLDAPIVRNAEQVEEERGLDVGADNAADKEAYLKPSRWWFASTAFPLIAGTFGPMASAFNICALAPRWRVTVGLDQSEDDGDTVPDPQWYVCLPHQTYL